MQGGEKHSQRVPCENRYGFAKRHITTPPFFFVDHSTVRTPMIETGIKEKASEGLLVGFWILFD
jgi:hypothetical protein